MICVCDISQKNYSQMVIELKYGQIEPLIAIYMTNANSIFSRVGCLTHDPSDKCNNPMIEKSIVDVKLHKTFFLQQLKTELSS